MDKMSNKSLTDAKSSVNCSIQGVFISYPESWEACKWIRCSEFIGTVVLNITLIALLHSKAKRLNLVYFMIHLAMSDVAVAILHILPLTIEHFVSDWSLGVVMCKLKFYTSNVSLYASTYIIVTISADRLFGVKYPMGLFRKTTKYRRVLVLLPWLLSSAVNIPTLLWTKVYTGESLCGRHLCSPDIRDVREIAVLLHATFLLFIPSALLISCYTFIAICLYKDTKATNFMVYSTAGKDTNSPNHYSAIRSKAKRRNVIMTFVVSLTFIGCWLPSILAYILNVYGKMGFGGWFDILVALSPLNSLLNPMIFVMFNFKTFQKLNRKRPNTEVCAEQRHHL